MGLIGSAIDNDELLWWEYYGLTEHPFNTPAQHAFFFLPKPWEEHLDLLQLLWQHGHELAVIQGGQGVGKTTLIQQFVEQLDHALPICHLLGSADLTAEELIEAMCGCFDLPRVPVQGSSVRMYLNSIIAEIDKREQRCLLIVDNLELVQTPVLQALCYLQAERFETESPLSIIVIMNNQFAEQFDKVADQYLEHEKIKILSIEPFSFSESKQYLIQRLVAAGMQGDLLFEDTDLKQLQQNTLGVAAKINEAAEELFIQKMQTYPYTETDSRSDSYFGYYKNKILGGLSFLVLAALFFSWWQHNQSNTFTQQRSSIATSEPTSINTANNQPSVSDAMPGANNLSANEQPLEKPADTTSMATTNSSSAPLTSANDNLQQMLASQQLIQNVGSQMADAALQLGTTEKPSMNMAASSTRNNKPLPKSISVVMNQVPAAEQTTATDSNKGIVTATSSIDQPTPEEEQAQGQQTKDTAPKPITLHYDHAVQDQTSPVIAKHPKSRLIAQGKKITHSTKHLITHKVRAQKIEQTHIKSMRQGYTIQLMGVRKLSDLTKYRQRAAHHHQPVQYIKTQFNGKDWYILTYGHYATPKAAKAALSNVPGNLCEKTTKPWVRNLRTVQTAIAMR